MTPRDAELVDGRTTVKVRALRLGSPPADLKNQFRALAAEMLRSTFERTMVQY